MKASDRLIKAFEKFNEEIKAYANLYGEDFATLYEDANTTRYVKDFHLCKNGKLTWVELELIPMEGWEYKPRKEEYQHVDEDDIRDTLNFWRRCFRKAKKYDALDPDRLDAIQDGEAEDIEE